LVNFLLPLLLSRVLRLGLLAADGGGEDFFLLFVPFVMDPEGMGDFIFLTPCWTAFGDAFFTCRHFLPLHLLCNALLRQGEHSPQGEATHPSQVHPFLALVTATFGAGLHTDNQNEEIRKMEGKRGREERESKGS